jgi:hypothetical protein
VNSVIDTVGNTYTAVVSETTGVYTGTYLAVNTSQLAVGAIVTATFSGASGTKDMIVAGCSGIASTDIAVSAHGTSTAPSVASGTMAYAPEMNMAGFEIASGTLTLGNGWTSIATNGNLTAAYQLTPSSTSLTASGTIGSSVAWGVTQTGLVPVAYPPPSLPVFAAGYPVLPSTFDNWIQDTLGFFAQTPVFRCEQINSQTLNNGTPTSIHFDTIYEDPTSSWNYGSYYWTAPWTGWYEVTFTFGYTLGTFTFANAYISVTGGNPTIQLGGCPSRTGTSAAYIVQMIGGVDTITFQAIVSTSGLSTVSGASLGTNPSAEITWVSS